MKRSDRISASSQRPGIAIAAVLVCILIVMMLSAALTREMVTEHRQARTMARQGQAFWIAESAMERALFQLRHDSKYRGETWKISASTLGTDTGARAEIAIGKSDGPSPERQITVRAYYPDEPTTRVLIERRLVLRNGD